MPSKPAYYMRAGKPYCRDCAAGFFGAPFPIGVQKGPRRECSSCGITVPALEDTSSAAHIDTIREALRHFRHQNEIARAPYFVDMADRADSALLILENDCYPLSPATDEQIERSFDAYR